jgi:hypothetical protein
MGLGKKHARDEKCAKVYLKHDLESLLVRPRIRRENNIEMLVKM